MYEKAYCIEYPRNSPTLKLTNYLTDVINMGFFAVIARPVWDYIHGGRVLISEERSPPTTAFALPVGKNVTTHMKRQIMPREIVVTITKEDSGPWSRFVIVI
jgi:hypothetical protein